MTISEGTDGNGAGARLFVANSFDEFAEAVPES